MQGPTQELAVLMMVKNEEDSIAVSIASLPPADIHTLIVYDTGSTDSTLDRIRDLCTTHHIQLYLKQASEPFHDFATSRNESLDFADTVADVHSVIMMDAGDELRCRSIPTLRSGIIHKGIPVCDRPTLGLSMREFREFLHAEHSEAYTSLSRRQASSPLGSNSRMGIVTLSWLEENSANKGTAKGTGELTEHYDIRFVKTRCGHRYIMDSPVHETFAGSDEALRTETTFPVQHWYLYQNRLLWGKSTSRRFQRDLELLHAAPPTARNLFYLGQTYIATNQYADGYIYNLRALVAAEKDRKQHVANIRTLYERIAVCALECQTPPPTFLPYLCRAIEYPHTPSIEAALNLMRYALNAQQPQLVEPYLTKIAAMEKIPGECVNHANYDFTRWWLLYKICMMLVLQARNQGSTREMIPTLRSGIIHKDLPVFLRSGSLTLSLTLWMDLGRSACRRVLEVQPTDEDRHNYTFFL
jgi:hypothetical protein